LKRERQSSVSMERTTGVARRVEEIRKKTKTEAEVVITSD